MGSKTRRKEVKSKYTFAIIFLATFVVAFSVYALYAVTVEKSPFYASSIVTPGDTVPEDEVDCSELTCSSSDPESQDTYYWGCNSERQGGSCVFNCACHVNDVSNGVGGQGTNCNIPKTTDGTDVPIYIDDNFFCGKALFGYDPTMLAVHCEDSFCVPAITS